jgi:hypothetical protein
MNTDQVKIIKKSRGSITIEACVALPIFLGFFIMILIMIKIACINIVLNHAVNETAKQLATTVYPISFLNEFENKIVDEYGEQGISSMQGSIKDVAYNTLKDTVDSATADIFLGNISMTDINNILNPIKQKGSETLVKGLGSLLVNLGEDAYWDIKDTGKYIITKAVMDQFINSNSINKNNLKFNLVEFPQGAVEYEACRKSKAIKNTGLIPDEDFGIDDVVIQIEYKFKIALPILGARTINFKHTAIEKGWIHGGNGVYTSRMEGIKLDDISKIQKIVYITRTGEKYHKESCRYLRLSKIPVELNDETKSSYEPCKVCKP